MKAFILIVCGLFLSVECPGQSVGWLDYSGDEISPVARPADFLRSHSNGFLCDGDIKHAVEFLAVPSQKGNAVLWETYSKAQKPLGSALIRIPLPESVGGKTIGVEFELFSDSDLNLEIEPYKGTQKKFWNFGKRRLGGKKGNIAVKKGDGKYRFFWQKAGVNAGKVGSFGVRRKDTGKLYIKKINLIFNNSKTAKKFEDNQRVQYRNTVRLMLRWVADCGIDLRPMLRKSDLKLEDLQKIEKLAWQGVQLLALEPQIENWSAFAKANSIKTKLSGMNSKRVALIEKLEKGQDVSADILAFQKNVDGEIDRLIEEIPIEKRRWRVVDNKFKDPAGKDYRFCGAHFFRGLFPPKLYPAKKVAPDVRYLAGLGFNGLRLHVVWKLLEPQRGKFDKEYLAMLRKICRQAERYGVAVSIDLHWPYPDWFVKGDPRYPIQGKLHSYDHHNPYHWPDALVDSWSRFSSEMSDVPNIIAWEVPTNEPGIGKSPRGLKGYPALLVSWNRWLKEKYKTRENLNKIWGAAGKKYALSEKESWDDNSIEPLGWQGDVDADYAYKHNPRLWDHVQWAAWKQKDLTGRIMQVIRKSNPDAVGMMQHTTGDIWDKSPVRINYHSIETLYGDHVQPGTHYGVASIQQYKSRSLSDAVYDSEQQMENNIGGVVKHVKLGGGFTAFAFHRLGGGGMLFIDDDWHLKPEVAYLPSTLRWAKKYKAVKNKGPAIAIINNTRLEATVGNLTTDVYEKLKGRGFRVAMFEGLKIAQNPDLLDGYKMVITSTSYMDSELLKVLDKKYKGKVFLYGSLDRDAWARKNVIPEELFKQGIFLNAPKVAQFDEFDSGRINLAGEWGCFFANKSEIPPKGPMKSFVDGKWLKKKVPGKWGDIGLIGSLEFHTGNAWYRKQIEIPASWKGRNLSLEIGAVDDFDWAYFNGKLIGYTDASKSNYWMIPRQYDIDQKLIKWGKPNELLICVHNNNADGGIVKGPVEIVSKDLTGLTITWPGARKSTPFRPSANFSLLKESQLRPDVKVILDLNISKTKTKVPALIKQKKWIWWCNEKIPPQIVKYIQSQF